MIEIRPAQPDDLPAMGEVKWRASWANEADRDFLAGRETEIRAIDAGLAHLVLVEDGALRAFVGVQGPRDGVVEIEDLFTDPDHMRRGFARQLVERLENIEGARQLRVSANPAAGEFYRALGFAEERRVVTEGGPGIRMSKRI